VHPQTLRGWEARGRITAVRLNERGDRRFDSDDVARLLRENSGLPEPSPQPVHAGYVRVSGRGDQLSSLAAQEVELTGAAGGTLVAVFHDVGSGLSEKRRGLHSALAAARRGEFTTLWVTHEDRLARFGLRWIRELFTAAGVEVKVVHPKSGGSPEAELVADFVALVASFSGCLYGQRSAEAKRRLLEKVTP
jgi:predicted site-specific integrase-resolvase